MTALITGASTGLGHDMAVYLSELGYDLILVARSKDKLQQLKKTLPVRVKVIAADLSKTENAVNIFRACKDMKIDLLINNAGIGEVGSFEKTSPSFCCLNSVLLVSVTLRFLLSVRH